MFSLESPHRGDSNKYTQYIIVNIKRKTTLNYSKSAAMGFFLGTQTQIRNNHGKRAISVSTVETRAELTLDDKFYIISFDNSQHSFLTNDERQHMQTGKYTSITHVNVVLICDFLSFFLLGESAVTNLKFLTEFQIDPCRFFLR